MPEYKTGCMPNTDFRYEEFEGLLGSFQMSLLPLRGSRRPEDQRDYQRAMEILNGFAQRYEVQSPEDAARNPRAREAWGNASVLSNWSMLDMMGSFWQDFGVGAEPRTQDQQERYALGRLILGVYARHGIARVGYETIEGQKVPVKVEDWDMNKSKKTLADVLSD